jgi:signal transduction histidine kinase
VSIVALIEEIEMIATIQGTERDIGVTVDGGSGEVAVDGNREILISALSNPVPIAVNFTPRRGRVAVRAPRRASAC